MLKTFKHPKYTYTKNGIYYFSIAVPNDLESYYSQKRIIQSLRTKSREKAKQSAQLLAGRLLDYWFHLRLQNTTPPLVELLKSPNSSNSITIDEALSLYLEIKGLDRPKRFKDTTTRNINYLKEYSGNKLLADYTLSDATKLRDSLLRKGLSAPSLHRIFSGIKAVINFAIGETGLDTKNPFSSIYLPPDKGVKRKPISADNLAKIKQRCFELDDDVRWLVALISDTGLRLSEAAGLVFEDINLEHPYPHVVIKEHKHRRLKTESSERLVPLVGASLWAAQRLFDNKDELQTLCFPRYTSTESTNSNSASATINKWLKSFTDDSVVIHGMRHSFRDRLRAVDAPLEVIDQIGGWSRKSVGQGYGDGYKLEQLNKWMRKME